MRSAYFRVRVGTAQARRTSACLGFLMGGIGLLLASALILPTLTHAQAPTPTPPKSSPVMTLTVTPAATRPFTPSPTPILVEPITRKIFDNIKFTGHDLNSLAVDARGNLYVPDANSYLMVFNANFELSRQIRVVEPVAVAFNRARDTLLVGRKYPATLDRYTLAGIQRDTLWSAPNTTLDCIVVDAQDAIYVIYTSFNKPYPRFMLKMDAVGNIIFLRVMIGATLEQDRVYGMTVDRDGTLNMTTSGFGRDPTLLSFWFFSPAGDRLLDRPRPYFSSLALRPPGYPLRLADGRLVIYSAYGLGWWSAGGRQIAFQFWQDVAGVPLRDLGVHGGIALGSDGKTIYYADITRDDKLLLGRTRLNE